METKLKYERKHIRITIEDHGITIPNQLVRVQSEVNYEQIKDSDFDVLEIVFKHTLERLKQYGKD